MSWYDNGFAEAAPLINVARSRWLAHRAFDAIWLQHTGDKRHVRSVCYRWLAHQLGVPKDAAHMRFMDEKLCARVVELCRDVSLASVLEWDRARRVESKTHKEN